MNEGCLTVSDGFHFRYHACNSNWDTDIYLSPRNHFSSGTEAINHFLGFSESHLRYLKPDNDAPFLTARSIFISQCAIVRRRENKVNLNALLFRRTVRDMWTWEYQRCSE